MTVAQYTSQKADAWVKLIKLPHIHNASIQPFVPPTSILTDIFLKNFIRMHV